MAKQPLPIIDQARSEFGFLRTVCACAECVRYCRHLPGYLIPTDLERIRLQVAPSEGLFDWAPKHLLASPGAKVLHRGRAFRIPTLVPARRADGACTFLTAEDRCAIHAVAPFGCAFFDAHQADADQRCRHGLQAVPEAWARLDLYAQVWLALDEAGLCAAPPEICRQWLRQAQENESRQEFPDGTTDDAPPTGGRL